MACGNNHHTDTLVAGTECTELPFGNNHCTDTPVAGNPSHMEAACCNNRRDERTPVTHKGNILCRTAGEVQASGLLQNPRGPVSGTA